VLQLVILQDVTYDLIMRPDLAFDESWTDDATGETSVEPVGERGHARALGTPHRDG